MVSPPEYKTPDELIGNRVGPQSGADNLFEVVKALPKVELHVHMEGSISAARVMQFAGRNGIRLPFKSEEDIQALYRYRSFREFARVLLLGVNCLHTPRDFHDVVWDIGQRMQDHNIRYAEITWTPQFYLGRGCTLYEILSAMNEARRDWSERAGIMMRWIPDLVRSRPGPAWKIVNWLVEDRVREMGVVALGLGGPEQGHPAREFEKVFRFAAERGLPANPHAGEGADPSGVDEAVVKLNARRIGHGVSSVRSPNTIIRLVANRIPLEVCVTSNIRLGLYPSAGLHPLRRLLDLGAPIVLGTDDPVLFETDLTNEYMLAMTGCGLSFGEILNTIRVGIDASYLGPAIKRRLHAALAKHLMSHEFDAA